ncbi:rho guanine nucleotide exchange factor TIAM1-like isoform X1 [Pristis pectinata]|uniref:rho guanine nucleotide exchange factor TIAM1-like isoform X1 n=3 Tax=Pristis pectinata TaxID=685728 RepID=UPI00223C99B9|nr:rho guanine nucleotide exchange factor TIAM1-like isoform X1 [Pristis pectinata]XP_051870605.1 rho guanine nucleotide exchange factor TIAM1-like isoform X1 [Pristis pectinata]XP_051870606.1 rho guanine nucleotide exchange factor TIAM1-like isoform X1 [Pristis pectinata]XP_051870607.1 rho guanine nucleotide exchange factor TIAM1-like isoform X1 [Pristis pectinata]
MGNSESQNDGERAFSGDERASLARRQMSRSLRIPAKTSHRARPASAVRIAHRNSETSTKSSSTPSIPQSLARDDLDTDNPGTHNTLAEDFIHPSWVVRMGKSVRPVSYHTGSSVSSDRRRSTVDELDICLDKHIVQGIQNFDEIRLDSSSKIKVGDLLPLTRNGTIVLESTNIRKKRSKSADMWRQDSMEFSLSDLSQDRLSSTEDLLDNTDEKGYEGNRLINSNSMDLEQLNGSQRANSLNELYGQKTAGVNTNKTRKNRFVTYCRNLRAHSQGTMHMENANTVTWSAGGDASVPSYAASTLPCRKSHCLSEGASKGRLSQKNDQNRTTHVRRSKTTQDVTIGDGSECADSGIDGATTDNDHLSRYSNISGSMCYPSNFNRELIGSELGSAGDALRQGVYENFRCTLESTVINTENPEEAESAMSDEQSSGTLSSPGQSDIQSADQGTVRKAGSLAVKNFLVHKKNKKVELATRRKWKCYWVSLKGCTLFFYDAEGRSGVDQNCVPKHMVWIENSIVQAVPEHPKKDFVFCLSNSLGDAFLFQTCSQTELENWITAIHSACAGAVAKQHRREDTVKLLQSEMKKLEQKIDMDEKMKKMGDMQLSSVNDPKKRKTILDQIFLWEQNLEQFQIDLFRYRCYMASLQGGELPNPKRLLAFASRPTKHAMGRLNIFSVSSFHALVAARTEPGLKKRTQAISRSVSKRRNRFSSLWGLDTTSRKKAKERPSINQLFGDSEATLKKSLEGIFNECSTYTSREKNLSTSIRQQTSGSDNWVTDCLAPSWVCLPNDQPILIVVHPGNSAQEILEVACKAHHLEPGDHYVRLKFTMNNHIQYYIPKQEDIHELLYQEIEICPKITHHVQFDKSDTSVSYGFCVSLVEEEESHQKMIITDIKEGGLASSKGLKAGDEVLEINKMKARDLVVSDLKTILSAPSLSLTVRTCGQPEGGQICLSPLRKTGTTDELDDTGIVSSHQEILNNHTKPSYDKEGLPALLETGEACKSTEQVTAFCRGLHELSPPNMSSQPLESLPHQIPSRQLTDADKLRKVICELVETEQTYVKDLNCLLERYLKPLQKEVFLTQDELDVLFGNLREMVQFQVEFLKTLEDGVRLVSDLEKLETVNQFKKVLFSLGGSFLYYADRFKLYSAFCASHTKVPKVLVKAKINPAFKAFLDAQNPKQQHSSTLESYLIKPIQRVLKYPLLLKELISLTDSESEEHYHLTVAMKAMNKVASHINEMQKLHEEYGAVFDQLIAEQTGEKKEVGDLSMGDLLLHSTVSWLNPPSSFGKCKKDPELAAFVFKAAVVLIYKDGFKQKRKLGNISQRVSVPDDRDPFRFRHMIPTQALQIRSVTATDAETDCVFEVVHTKSESEGRPETTFHFCSSTPENKRDFIKAVQSILRDKQRRQLLKTESLPQSQQYMPFGGKRLCALKGARPVVNRAVSVPCRSLGKKRLSRNRFTIDADDLFGRSQNNATLQSSVTCSDTDRWVEEQFDLAKYEEQEDVKETDILSDDDEYCQSVKSSSLSKDLQEQLKAINFTKDGLNENGKLSMHKTPENSPSKMGFAMKQKPAAGANGIVENSAAEIIWVKREDFISINKENDEN